MRLPIPVSFFCSLFRETVLLTNICTALAEGLIQPWVPPPPSKDPVDPNADTAPRESSPAGKKGGKAAPALAKGKSSTTVTVNPDASPDLKNAVEVRKSTVIAYDIFFVFCSLCTNSNLFSRTENPSALISGSTSCYFYLFSPRFVNMP